MPLPYHTHIFKLEPATKEEVKEGVLDSKALAPVSVGSAAAYGVEYFATAAQGKKADDAVAKRDIGALAYKDKVTICDIEASGEAHENTILSGDGWIKISPLGIGDMSAVTYDPDNVRSNVFSMENMNEGPTKKILTIQERLKLQWLSPTQPTMEKWRMGDEGVHYPISPVELKNTINYFAISKSLGMSKSIYDPDKIAKDAFDMDNMKEGNEHLILTPQERTQIAKINKVEDDVEQGIHIASEAKNVADVALNTAKDAKTTADVAQKTADKAQAEASVAQTTAGKAQDIAYDVQKKVDLIQPLKKQDWIDGIKTVDALISPVDLLASIKANSSNDSGYKKPIEILITESGNIPWPEGITDETELEIWAWGGGDAGSDSLHNIQGGEGGFGGCCTYVRTKKKFLGNNSVRIGKGGKFPKNPAGYSTVVGQFITAFGGKDSIKPYQKGVFKGENAKDKDSGDGGDGFLGGHGGKGGYGGYDNGLGNGGSGGRGGDNFLSDGGWGGWGGDGGDFKGGKGGRGGNGGSSIYGLGGRGGRGGDGGTSAMGGRGGDGGKGGDGGSSVYGGGGGGGTGGKGGKGGRGDAVRPDGMSGKGGDGGSSVYGGGGGGGGSYSNGQVGHGGHSMWGGHGGKGALSAKGSKELYGGGGGGYFPGKDATSSSSGDGGDGAVLIKVYL
ncbi:hypothetical protein [Bartonella sp. B1098]|uniref:hypothetical protein n=1 Tax=Bartonella sp. B1098 TaxID=2911421 RepID=UPI0020C2BA22|nr:hypothetical protein [Bartonella sp. B1098]